jgi:hypothetical protein
LDSPSKLSDRIRWRYAVQTDEELATAPLIQALTALESSAQELTSAQARSRDSNWPTGRRRPQDLPYSCFDIALGELLGAVEFRGCHGEIGCALHIET